MTDRIPDRGDELARLADRWDSIANDATSDVDADLNVQRVNDGYAGGLRNAATELRARLRTPPAPDDEAIAAIRELRAKITPGEWRLIDTLSTASVHVIERNERGEFDPETGEYETLPMFDRTIVHYGHGFISATRIEHANADFIAAAPTAIDTLLARDDTMRAHIEAQKRDLQQMARDFNVQAATIEAETIERCAKVADDYRRWVDGALGRHLLREMPHNVIAKRIRALSPQPPANETKT